MNQKKNLEMQLENLPTDHRTDIYSAGITLFHLVTGSIPFYEKTYFKIARKHLDEPVPRIKEYRNDIPEKLIQIIEKCMAKKKEDRYQSASEVIEEIYEIKDESGNTIITEREKSELFGPQKETLPSPKDEGDTEKLDLDTAHFIKILNDEKRPIDIRKNAVNSLEQIGGTRAIEALKKVSTEANEQLAKAALDALKKLYELDLEQMDIPTFAYHLVLCRYASPELLIELNPVEFKKAIQEIYPGEKGDEDLVPALQIFEEKYSNQKPEPLWHSWITTTRGERIKEVKKMFEEIINP
jgi:serine/threonine protein kinase